MEYLEGAYGYHNIGDDCILLSLIKERNCKVIANGWLEYYDIKERLNIDAIHIGDIQSNFVEGDVVSIGGGTLLHSHSFNDDSFVKFAERRLKQGYKVRWESIGVLGVDDKEYVKDIMNKSEDITVRDIESKDYLMGLGVVKEIKVVGDPVERVNLFPYLDKNKEDMVGIVYSASQLERNTVIELCKNIDKRIRFYPFTGLGNDNDMLYESDVVRELNLKRVEMYCGNFNPWGVMRDMNRCRWIISTRLHPLILGNKCGSKVIGFEFGDNIKCKRYLDRIKGTVILWDSKVGEIIDVVKKVVVE